jgi:ATP-binding cassette subfamily B protein
MLSGGQRRRIALARAVVREEARLLLLDEPTTGLDAEGEATMLEALMRVAHGRTTIIVSHTLGISTLADRVVVLDGGRIVEEGVPGELLTRGGAYVELWSKRTQSPRLARARTQLVSQVKGGDNT